MASPHIYYMYIACIGTYDQCSYYHNIIIIIVSPVGEPLNDEAWLWYHNVVGEGRCTVVDTWWQTGIIVFITIVSSAHVRYKVHVSLS